MAVFKYKKSNKTFYGFQVPDTTVKCGKRTIKLDVENKDPYTTKKQAQLAEARWLETHKELSSTNKLENILFEDVTNEFLRHCEKTCASGTVANYRNYCNKHLQEFVGLEVNKISRLQVQEWFDNNVAFGKSPYIINGCRKLLKASFNFALKMELIDKNPFQFMDKEKEPVIKRNRFSVDELRNLLALCQKEMPQFYLMFVLLNLVGLRSGELKALTKDNTGNIIHIFQQYYRGEIKTTKTEASKRELEVGEFIQNAIKWHCVKYKVFSGYLFPSPKKKNKPISHKTLDRYFHKLLRLAGYETGAKGEKHYMRVHDLRGEYADLMHMAGVPLVVTAKNMGHSNTRTTEKHYTQVLPEANKQAVNAIDSLFLI